MPPPDLPASCFPNFSADDETRAAAETLKLLQGGQGKRTPLASAGLSTPQGEADHFKEGGSWRVFNRLTDQNTRILPMPVTQQHMPDILAASISSISVNLIPPAVVLTKTKPGEGPPNVVLPGLSGFGKQAACELTDTRNSGGPGVSKDNQPPPSQQGVPTVPAGGSSSGSGGASQDRQDPNGPS